jgi:hypothetical protein
MECAGRAVCMGLKLIAYKVLVGKPKGNIPLGRSRYKKKVK